MLLHLHVKNLALIREAEIDFAEGLNILTGETGAGKSILIGSMTMALGGKTGDSFPETVWQQKYLQAERRDCEHGGAEGDFLHAH